MRFQFLCILADTCYHVCYQRYLLSGCEDVSPLGGPCISFMTSDGEHLSRAFNQVHIFLVKCLCKYFAHFESVYFFLEEGKGREKERERNIDVREKH